MGDAHDVLGLPRTASDEAIRERYVEMVRKYPPDHFPERFKTIREAYEHLKHWPTRIKNMLWERPRPERVEAALQSASRRRGRKRLSLEVLLAVTRANG